MGRVAGVLDDPPGFPCTPPGVDILEGGKLTSNNVAGSSHDPLQSPAVASGAVSKPFYSKPCFILFLNIISLVSNVLGNFGHCFEHSSSNVFKILSL